MTLLDLSVELTRTNEFLSRMAVAEERIADALERLSPRLPDFPRQTYKATVSDLLDVSPAAVQSRLDAMNDFADRNQVSPQTEAFRAKVTEYEDAIRKEYGQEVVDSLPWNKK